MAKLAHTVLPFSLDAAQVRDKWFPTIAARKFGGAPLFKHWLHNLFGWPRTSPIREIAFRRVLLPVWKLDVSAKLKASLDRVDVEMSVSTFDASLSAHEIEPLNGLSLVHHRSDEPGAQGEPVFFDRDLHSTTPDGHPVTIVPFTLTPCNLLEKIRALPRIEFDMAPLDPSETAAAPQESSPGQLETIEQIIAQKNPQQQQQQQQADMPISISPASIEASMFAYYPQYLSVYLGEYEVREEDWFPRYQLDNAGPLLKDRPRATIAQMAFTSGPAYAIYGRPAYVSGDIRLALRAIFQQRSPSSNDEQERDEDDGLLQEPRWEPAGEFTAVAIGAIPNRFGTITDPKRFKQLLSQLPVVGWSKFMNWDFEKGRRKGLRHWVDRVVDVYGGDRKRDDENGDDYEWMAKDARCLAYDEHSFSNKFFMATELDYWQAKKTLQSVQVLDQDEQQQRQVEEQEGGRETFKGTRGVQFGSPKEVVEAIEGQVRDKRKLVEDRKPRWLKDEETRQRRARR